MSSLNYMELCRLCLVKDRVQIPIFEGEGDIRQIFLKIAACLPVKVKKDDKLPKKICDECMYKVESLYQFWNTTANAEKQLLEWLGEAVEDKKTSSDAQHVKQEGLEQDPCSELAKSLSRVEAVLAEAREAESDNDHFATGKAETDSDDEPLSSLEPTTFVNVGLDGSGTSESRTQGEFLAPGAPSTSKTSNSTNAQTTTSGCEDSTRTKEMKDGDLSSIKTEEDGEYENQPLSKLRMIWSSDNESANSKTESQLGSVQIKTEMTNRVCESEKLFKCMCCSEVEKDITSLLEHLTSNHSGQTYPCSNCEFRTDSVSELGKHLLSNSCGKNENIENGVGDSSSVKGKTPSARGSVQKKSHACDLCERSFTLKNQLLKHKNQEHGADIQCDICSVTFSSMVSLRSHKFTKHTGKDKICEICGYSTKKTYDFKRHQVKHSNVYTIKCTVCNKGFYSQYDFNEHKNVHTAERPYQCEVCGVDYSRRSSLILHRNRKHPETYDLSKRCHICNQVCLTKETMEAHVKTHVEGRKKFYCDICGKGLLTRVILKIHRRSHTGEKPFDCSYCGRAFSCKKNLSVHIRLHTGDRPYSCKFCWKAYTKSSALKAHEKSHSNHHQVIPL